ncbi:hypothetical protein B0H14DRAFT_2614078 [Mycena olivaceomarginata]|nr:hypothetical protein B0H14DRAFT_2614078 [Mycena olivaceomarginata]
MYIQKQAEGHKEQGIFDSKEKPHKIMKVCHVVVEPKNNGEEDNNDGIKLRDWPVKSDAARTALAAMEETHRVHRLPAYNVDGELIAPAQYARFLSAAVVRATISIKCWAISSDKRDTYVADIECFRVVIPAPVHAQPGPSSPRKRKVLETKDYGASQAQVPKKYRLDQGKNLDALFGRKSLH